MRGRLNRYGSYSAMRNKMVKLKTRMMKMRTKARSMLSKIGYSKRS